MWRRVLLLVAACALLLLRFRERYGAVRMWEYDGVPLAVLVAVVTAVMVVPALPRRVAFDWPIALVLLVLQHVYFGGWQHFPQLLLHGRLSFELCTSRGDFDTAVSVYVMSSGDPARTRFMQAQLAEWGVRYALVPGGKNLPGMGNTLGYKNLLIHAYRAYRHDEDERARPWALMLEDDAVLHWRFKQQVACALDPAVDLTWLDARSDISVQASGRYDFCYAGMLIRKHALPSIFLRLGPNTSFHEDFHRRSPEWEYLADPLLAELCNRHVIRCRSRPLVSEGGFPSLAGG